jgi:hypothetical protein
MVTDELVRAVLEERWQEAAMYAAELPIAPTHNASRIVRLRRALALMMYRLGTVLDVDEDRRVLNQPVG